MAALTMVSSRETSEVVFFVDHVDDLFVLSLLENHVHELVPNHLRALLMGVEEEVKLDCRLLLGFIILVFEEFL